MKRPKPQRLRPKGRGEVTYIPLTLLKNVRRITQLWIDSNSLKTRAEIERAIDQLAADIAPDLDNDLAA